MPCALQFITQDQAHDHADDADDNAAEKCRPETVHAEAEVKCLPNGTGEHEQDGVDDNGKQPKREENKWTGEEFQQWPHQRV